MPMAEHAAANPDKIATVMAGSGQSLTYGEMNERSIRLAHHLRAAGLGPGDVVALFMENNIRYHEVFWAAVRSGVWSAGAWRESPGSPFASSSATRRAPGPWRRTEPVM